MKIQLVLVSGHTGRFEAASQACSFLAFILNSDLSCDSFIRLYDEAKVAFIIVNTTDQLKSHSSDNFAWAY